MAPFDGQTPAQPQRVGLGLGAWIAALSVGLVLFHTIGDGPLAAPPLDPAGWLVWAEARDPLVATFAVLRLLVLALSWYLAGAIAVGFLARLLRAAQLITIADALTIPALRRALQGTLGVSLATAMVVSAAPLASAATRAGSPVASAAVISQPHRGAPPAATRTDVGETDESLRGHGMSVPPVPLQMLDRARGRAKVPNPPDPTSDAEAAADPDEGAPGADGPGAAEHRVRPGESFWTIASDVLAVRLGRVPSDRETEGYWRSVVEANRARLTDDDNPDLIFPGQSVVLPPGMLPHGVAG